MKIRRFNGLRLNESLLKQKDVHVTDIEATYEGYVTYNNENIYFTAHIPGDEVMNATIDIKTDLDDVDEKVRSDYDDADEFYVELKRVILKSIVNNNYEWKPY